MPAMVYPTHVTSISEWSMKGHSYIQNIFDFLRKLMWVSCSKLIKSIFELVFSFYYLLEALGYKVYLPCEVILLSTFPTVLSDQKLY